MRERERERERERGDSTTSVNLCCYYFAVGSYILKFKEVLLEVADIKGRYELYTIAEWKYVDLFCVVPISRKLKRCIINVQISLKFLYISVLP